MSSDEKPSMTKETSEPLVLAVPIIFSLGGVGQYAAEAITNLDLPPLMAITIFGAFFVVLFNALADVVYAYLDPRIRLGTSAR